MGSLVRHITIDSADAYQLGAFWAEVLDGTVHEDDKPGDEEVLVAGAGGTLLFVTVARAEDGQEPGTSGSPAIGPHP